MRRRPLTSGQIRAARAFLRWRAEDLARESAVGVATIRRAELADSETSMTTPNDLSVRRALEAAGVEFIDENGGGPGVRLRKHERAKGSKTWSLVRGRKVSSQQRQLFTSCVLDPDIRNLVRKCFDSIGVRREFLSPFLTARADVCEVRFNGRGR